MASSVQSADASPSADDIGLDGPALSRQWPASSDSLRNEANDSAVISQFANMYPSDDRSPDPSKTDGITSGVSTPEDSPILPKTPEPQFHGQETSTTGDNLPELVLDRICSFLPFKDVIKCANLSRRWRDYVRKSPRWQTFVLGQEVNRHVPFPTDFARAHFGSVVNVELTASVPVFAQELLEADRMWDNDFRENKELEKIKDAMIVNVSRLSLALIADILRYGTELRSLDISSMRLSQKKINQLERVWSSADVNASQLQKLSLPEELPVSLRLLATICGKHPNLEHLAFTIANNQLNEIKGFEFHAQLRSLDIRCVDHGNVEKLLRESLHHCERLETLTVDRIYAENLRVDWPPAVATGLKHLLLKEASFDEVMMILHHCLSLESLTIESVDTFSPFEDHPAPPVENASLRSVYLGSISFYHGANEDKI